VPSARGHGVVSFLHRFGSAVNHRVHLHACVTEGVFMPAADDLRPALFSQARHSVPGLQCAHLP